MKVLIIAPRGKMGTLITKAAHQREDMTVIGGIAPKGRDYIGQDIGMVAGLGEEIGAKVYDDLDKIIGDCDGIIDFSTREVSMEVLKKATSYQKALMIGTTGFSKEEFDKIHLASKEIPIVYATNTSSVINLMYELLSITATAIGNHSDIEIIDMHDKDKLDAPSGTANEMGTIIAKSLGGKPLDDLAVYGRSNLREDAVRVPGSIGYHSVRSGDISSTHTVIFGQMGERLEITHHAYNWMCFARGSCDALAFLEKQVPGMYTFKEVLGL